MTPQGSSPPAPELDLPPTRKTGSKGPISWYHGANKKVLAGVVIIVVTVAALMITSLGDALTYYNTVDELKKDGANAIEDRRRVGGRVLTGTIEKDGRNNLSFAIYHNEPTDTLPVHYRGITPDLFGEEVDVIVEGKLQSDGVFYASNLIAQHPPEFKVAEPGSPHDPVKDRSIRQ